jgi:phage baseplate assembly protein V
MDNFRAYVETVDDESDFRIARGSYLEDQLANIELITPYGFDHNPPEGCWILTLPVNNSNENLTGMADNPLTRFKNLKSGEVVVWNPKTGSYFKFNTDGSLAINSVAATTITSTGAVNLTAPSVTVTAPTVNITGNVTITGNAVITGTLTTNGIGFATHVHGGVQTGGGNTGVAI